MKSFTEKELKKIVKRLKTDDLTYIVGMFMHVHGIKRIKGSLQAEGKKKMKYYYFDGKKTKKLKEVEK